MCDVVHVHITSSKGGSCSIRPQKAISVSWRCILADGDYLILRTPSKDRGILTGFSRPLAKTVPSIGNTLKSLLSNLSVVVARKVGIFFVIFTTKFLIQGLLIGTKRTGQNTPYHGPVLEVFVETRREREVSYVCN